MTDTSNDTRTVRRRGRRHRPTRADANAAAQEATFTAEVTSESPLQVGGTKTFIYYARPYDAEAGAKPISFVSLEGGYVQGDKVEIIQRKAKGDDTESYFTDAKNPDPNFFISVEVAKAQAAATETTTTDADPAPDEPTEESSPTPETAPEPVQEEQTEEPPTESEPTPAPEPKKSKTSRKKSSKSAKSSKKIPDTQESVPQVTDSKQSDVKVNPEANTGEGVIISHAGSRDVVFHIPDALVHSGKKVSVTMTVEIS
jgi:hypothetical protein